MGVFSEFNEISIHFSKAIGASICDNKEQRIGRLLDFFVDFEEMYPAVLALQIKINGKLSYIPWEDVRRFSFEKIILKDNYQVIEGKTFTKLPRQRINNNILAPQYTKESFDYPPLGKLVLDRQIVDTHGKKVVRVNDIQFIKTGQQLRVTHAAIGFRSLIRRLGFEPLFNIVLKIIMPWSKKNQSVLIINWKYVHAIPSKAVGDDVQLNVTNQLINSLHPADLADILEDLDANAREMIFNELSPELAAQTLSEIEPDMQASLIQDTNPEQTAKIIENMGTDEAADILQELSNEDASKIISRITDDEIQEEIRELFEHDEDSAGGLMSTEVFEVSINDRKSDIIKIIQERYDEYETIYDLYVIDDRGKLVGTCPLYKLLVHKEDVLVRDVMNSRDIKHLGPEAHWKQVASYMSKYNLITLPITEDDGTLLGMVSVDDVLPWLLDER